ncbi:hypothetical protein DFA_05989 [Cavenderia fasciculata]|uniref:Glutathione S-transferase n=1 Tax=Cavenderia fasciculata TaxID=261658 RepID=F4PJS9_CACFS|nr:uncharacterized protein DFA_05989 [Cavenderia fasciculata]EGG23853.1 hypothetical protein DFA_05989 [Cavenderia fasciculata]|eukprot:XP_004361704.1 hypothetical protein DFA_05989 [Cavenderia fasciculata]
MSNNITNLKNIKLYSTNSPNVAKVYIFLSHLQLPFEVIPISFRKGEQYSDEFIAINPNSKIPVIIDTNRIGEDGKPVKVWESGNILIYLAKNYGKGLYLPNEETNPTSHYEVLNFLFLQMASVGPTLGQLYHYTFYAQEKVEYAINRHATEARRLLSVLNRQLSTRSFVAGDELSVADFAIFPWTRLIQYFAPHIVASDYPFLVEYNQRLEQFESTKAFKLYDESFKGSNQKPLNDDERKVLFGRDH